jgi:hypothetical protein
MAMTIAKMHKLLGEMIQNGHGRKRVCVDKSTFRHPLEGDGAVILDVDSMEVVSFPMLDDDGFTKTRSDGSESCHTAAVICGDYTEP